MFGAVGVMAEENALRNPRRTAATITLARFVKVLTGTSTALPQPLGMGASSTPAVRIKQSW